MAKLDGVRAEHLDRLAHEAQLVALFRRQGQLVARRGALSAWLTVDDAAVEAKVELDVERVSPARDGEVRGERDRVRRPVSQATRAIEGDDGL